MALELDFMARGREFFFYRLGELGFGIFTPRQVYGVCSGKVFDDFKFFATFIVTGMYSSLIYALHNLYSPVLIP